jgi:hypothetical protein
MWKRNASKTGDFVPFSDAKEQVRKACERIALLHYAYASTLTKELGEERGTQMAMNAIKLYGTLVGQGVRKEVEGQGLPASAENYGGDLPSYGMSERTESVKTSEGVVKRVYGCAMAGVWRELGAEALGRIYCYVDPCKFMAYNPDYKLVHLKAVPDGDEYCEMVVVPTNEHDRAEFAKKDADLRLLDR